MARNNTPYSFLLLLFVFLSCSANLFAQGYQGLPKKSNTLVTDFGGIFTKNQEAKLEGNLSMYNDSTSTEIAIVSVKSLNGRPISEYAFDLAEAWGIGKKGKDNGILVLVAPNERKTFIATGYGVEAYVPDAVAKQIVDKVMLPYFRKGDYYGGVDSATKEIFERLTGAYKGAPREADGPGFPWELVVMLLFMLLILYLSSRRRNDGRQTYSGRGVDRFPRPYEWGRGPTWGDFSGGTGTFDGGKNRGRRTRTGGGWIFIPGGGGSSRSSGGGGGFSGGGGFGGFGGGSFGGGGAGGSW